MTKTWTCRIAKDVKINVPSLGFLFGYVNILTLDVGAFLLGGWHATYVNSCKTPLDECLSRKPSSIHLHPHFTSRNTSLSCFWPHFFLPEKHAALKPSRPVDIDPLSRPYSVTQIFRFQEETPSRGHSAKPETSLDRMISSHQRRTASLKSSRL